MRALTYSLCLALGVGSILSCNIENKDNPAMEQTVTPPSSIVEEKPKFVEIEGLGPSGDSVKFSNIKAKYILVEFWASWCPPCRQFNPGLVNIYNKYQSKGFEIISISLDHKADKWKSAIAKDGLKWPYHISDLGGWDSHWALEYGIESIPANFLVDPSGKVLASSLTHEQLESTLNNLLK